MSRYRLYLDESGDHTSSDPRYTGKKYLGLTGVIIKLEDCWSFKNQIENFKRRHLPYDTDNPPILHREDIINKRNQFRVLLNEGKRQAFDDDLLSLIQTLDFTIITVVIDKTTHGVKTYRRVTHPYHFSLEALIERYCYWLSENNSSGDVMAESRGKKEDGLLKRAYLELCLNGARYLPHTLSQKSLSSRKLKLKKKEANIAGLQLADLLAHPLKRDVLLAYNKLSDREGRFADRISQVVEPKYRRSGTGRIRGWGQVILV